MTDQPTPQQWPQPRLRVAVSCPVTLNGVASTADLTVEVDDPAVELTTAFVQDVIAAATAFSASLRPQPHTTFGPFTIPCYPGPAPESARLFYNTNIKGVPA